MIKVLLFAGLAEKVSTREIMIDRESMSIEELKHWIGEKYPAIQDELVRVMVAVNEEFTHDQKQIQAHDEVALIPPVSGG